MSSHFTYEEAKPVRNQVPKATYLIRHPVCVFVCVPRQPVGTNKLTSESTCILEDFKASRAFDSSAVIPGNTQGSLPCVAFLPLGLLPYRFLFRIHVSARHWREAPLDGHGCGPHPQTFRVRGGAVSQACLPADQQSLCSLAVTATALQFSREIKKVSFIQCSVALSLGPEARQLAT